LSVATPELRVAVPNVVLPLAKVTEPVGFETPETVAVNVTAVPSIADSAEVCKVVVVAGRTRPWRVIDWGESTPFVA